jgi:predicted ATPase
VLSRLGVLPGTFILKDAQAAAASEDLSVHDVTEAICALIAKSLVAAHLEQGHVEYSLLETTRCYALQRLEANGRDEVEASPVPVQGVLRYSWQLD